MMFDDQDEDNIADMYAEGYTASLLADIYYCSTGTIHNIAKKYGTSRGSKIFRSEQQRRILADYNAGITLSVLAKRYGFSAPCGVSAILTRMAARGANVKWRRK